MGLNPGYQLKPFLLTLPEIYWILGTFLAYLLLNCFVLDTGRSQIMILRSFLKDFLRSNYLQMLQLLYGSPTPKNVHEV